MFGTGLVRFTPRPASFRALASALFALLCLFSLASDATRALCLDLGGQCSPSTASPDGPCHDGDAGSGAARDCGSCVDIPIPEDASASGGPCDAGVRPLFTALSHGVPGLTSAGLASAPVAATASAFARLPRDFSSRSAALRI